MARGGLDARHIAPHHVKEHAQFLRDLRYMHAEAAAQKREAAVALLHYLSNWLAYHILGSDQLMARAMRAIAQGVPAHAAYLSFNKDRDPATATLLRAMNRLIEQVSERNRALFELNQNLEWNKSTAPEVPLSCMMVDADGFKTIHDSYGHDAGDTVLRSQVAALRMATGAGEWFGSVSDGVAQATPAIADKGVDAWLKLADESVYLAKRNGRNCVATVQGKTT